MQRTLKEVTTVVHATLGASWRLTFGPSMAMHPYDLASHHESFYVGISTMRK